MITLYLFSFDALKIWERAGSHISCTTFRTLLSASIFVSLPIVLYAHTRGMDRRRCDLRELVGGTDRQEYNNDIYTPSIACVLRCQAGHTLSFICTDTCRSVYPDQYPNVPQHLTTTIWIVTNQTPLNLLI